MEEEKEGRGRLWPQGLQGALALCTVLKWCIALSQSAATVSSAWQDTHVVVGCGVTALRVTRTLKR